MKGDKFFYLLIITLLVIIVILRYVPTDSTSGIGKDKMKEVNVIEGYELISKNKDNTDFVILDVRTANEFASEYIDGAIQIDYYANDFETKISTLEKEKTYLVYCRTGRRSEDAVRLLNKIGIENAINMQGGILDWQEKGYKVIS